MKGNHRNHAGSDDAMTNKSEGQTNWCLGMNTAYFHLQYPLPGLSYQPFSGSFSCSGLAGFNGQLPFPDEIDASGGTPNQKTERVANQIAYYFFTNPDRKKGPEIYKSAVAFFNEQAETTGHQCVDKADEALTASHGPIWWRAILSLRITSWALANGKISWFSDGDLENAILGWIQAHYALSQLGEILGGPQIGKVLLPGARRKGSLTLFPSDPCPTQSAPDLPAGSAYPPDPMTDQVSNVVYQVLKTGSVSGVPWHLGDNFWNLDPCDLDTVAAPLAKSAVDNGLGFGTPPDSPPLLHSQLVVNRYSSGHVASFPCGMPEALSPALWAWADYDTGCMALSSVAGSPAAPSFQGSGSPQVVSSVLPCSKKNM